MSFSDYLEGGLLDHLFNISSYTQPTLYVGLSTADPQDDGSSLAEPSGNGYSRVAVSGWSRSGSTVDNDSDISFSTATGSWGTITHGCLFDSSTGGNLLLSFALDSSKSVSNGDTVKFAAGQFNVTLD
jgi:hypothetical protein